MINYLISLPFGTRILLINRPLLINLPLLVLACFYLSRCFTIRTAIAGYLLQKKLPHYFIGHARIIIEGIIREQS